MTDEAEVLRSAIENRKSEDREQRRAALFDILDLANYSDNLWIRGHAIHHLQDVEGIAVIIDAAQPPVLATSNGVHIEPRVAVR